MEMICISSFGKFGQIKGISFNKIYKVKFTTDNKLLIINDFGKPQLVIKENFVNYNILKSLSEKFLP